MRGLSGPRVVGDLLPALMAGIVEELSRVAVGADGVRQIVRILTSAGPASSGTVARHRLECRPGLRWNHGPAWRGIRMGASMRSRKPFSSASR